MLIPVGADIKNIGAILEPTGHETEAQVLLSRWSFLLPSDTNTAYILTITDNLNGKIEEFEMDVNTKKAKRIKSK